MSIRTRRLLHGTGLAMVAAAGLLMLPGGPAKASDAQPEDTLAADIAKLGLRYKSHRPLERNYMEITLDDGRKIIGRVLPDTLFFSGGYSRSGGTDEMSELASANGALPPVEVLSMIGKPASDEGAFPKGTSRELPSVKPPLFGEIDFKVLLAAPGELLFPDRPKESARIVMFTWSECAACGKMREYFLANRDRMDFQVLFVPIAGNRNLDMSALSFLGMADAEAGEKQSALKRLHEASDVLGSRVGKILVPAFAWLDNKGNARIGNLTAATFREITSALNGGRPLP